MRQNRLLMMAVIAAVLVAGLVVSHLPKAAAAEPRVELFGHVTLVQGCGLSTYTGCHALIALRDTPGTTVAVMTKEVRLQTALETALSTGGLVAFWGRKTPTPLAPMGGTWSVPLYDIDSVIVYK